MPSVRNILFVLCLIVAAATAAMPSESSRRPYLALGDSVVFGFINDAGFEYVNPENFVGFPDYLGLRLRVNVFDAGCPGETTGSFLSTSVPDNGCRFFKSQAPLHVAYTGTQSSYALSFLAKHPETRLVTIMLGADDIFLLQSACIGDPTCIAKGLPQVLATLGSNMVTILAEVRGTGYRGVIVVANYYSLDYTNASGTEITELLNQTLATAAQTQGAVVADVFSAFQVAAFTPFAGGQTCKAGLLNSNGSPNQSPNQFTCDVHPSQSGQKLIARAIETAYTAALGGLE